MNHLRMTSFVVEIAIILGVASGCAEQQAIPPAAPPQPPPVATAPSAPAPGPTVAAPSTPPPAPAATPLSPPIDEAAIASATGVEKPEKSPDGIVKATFPRKDVDVDGRRMEDATLHGPDVVGRVHAGESRASEAMVMGDLVLFEDEVNPVMSVALRQRPRGHRAPQSLLLRRSPTSTSCTSAAKGRWRARQGRARGDREGGRDPQADAEAAEHFGRSALPAKSASTRRSSKRPSA